MNFCEYGCGREAKYQFKNGKWCCSPNHAQCEIIKEKQRKLSLGRKMPKMIEIKSEEDKVCFYCGSKAKYVTARGRYCCRSNVQKCPVIIKKQKQKL